MNSRRITLPILATLFTTFGLSPIASSVTITGEIPVSLTITAACAVNSGGGAGTTWGTIDFGSHSNLMTNIDSQVTNSGSSGITISCPVGLSAALKIGQGGNPLNSLRRLTPGTGTYNVPYRLYSDSTRSTEIPLIDATGIAIPATGNPLLIPIYARIAPADQTVMSPAAGSYTDTITATIEW
ncbi:spore coat U domain-containing protein [Pectobacterium wasabiae]|uniref:Spore coat protein U n=1 Tax=Pectobacterium wasabiae TaxID=55208 RepID=A0AAW3EHA0_9GAMM|nr:spore coat U domain-containing protein [Pectobacterium wasabiae]AOR61900.1 spore coat protein U [Pectobacterium wasabiae CFBP 3304]EJS95230.1 Spore Coat Protein U domain family protein [Pectobacterium wasabiae CFBP 3304]KFX08183.1 spore coat protein U [Pectobacterium wasabiae]KGA30818.1 spore coat protein U [Pectobacterium wasabiae]